jgi:hypothetical protein
MLYLLRDWLTLLVAFASLIDVRVWVALDRCI